MISSYLNENLLNALIAIVSLILGWILAIFGQLINELIKKRSTKKDITAGVKSELEELQIHLTSICLSSTLESDSYNKMFFQWLKPYYIKMFEVVGVQNPALKFNADIKKVPEEVLFNMIPSAYTAKSNNPLVSADLTYQNISCPYINLKIDSVSLFESKIHKLIFKFIRELNIINGDINQLWFYHSNTFSVTKEYNITILQANIKLLHGRVGRRSRILIELIDQIINCLK